jgi:hypothetical protein
VSTTTTPQPYGPVDPNGPFPPAPAPKKSHKLRNGIIGGIALLALIGGCSSALSSGGTDTAPDESATTGPAKPVEKAKPAPEPTKEMPKSTMTKSQEEAMEAAESYLDSGHFSKKGLTQQLSSDYGEGFSKTDAKFAVGHVKADWKAEAVEAAESYLDSGHFSRKGLIEQLESPYGGQFTHDQAVYGVTKAGL